MASFLDAFLGRSERKGKAVRPTGSLGEEAGGALRQLFVGGLTGRNPGGYAEQFDARNERARRLSLQDAYASGDAEAASRIDPAAGSAVLGFDQAQSDLDQSREDNRLRALQRRAAGAYDDPSAFLQSAGDLVTQEERALIEQGGADAMRGLYGVPKEKSNLMNVGGGVVYDPDTGEFHVAPRPDKSAEPMDPLKEARTRLVEAQIANLEGKQEAAAAKEAAKAEKEAGFKNRLEKKLLSTGRMISSLEDLEALPSADRGSVQNIGSLLLSGPGGLTAAKASPDPKVKDAASLIDSLETVAPGIMIDIKQAGGVGAKMLDSNADREYYQRQVPSADKDRISNLVGIQILSQTFGNGSFLDSIELPDEVRAAVEARVVREAGLAPELTAQVMQAGGLQTYNASRQEEDGGADTGGDPRFADYSTEELENIAASMKRP